MESMFTRALILLFLLSAPALAGGRGGHVQKWDPNLFGGGWVCLTTLATGCTTNFGATCNGIADDTAAITSFRTYAAAHPNTKLYIPPGANCINISDGSFTFTSGAQNLIAWA